MGLRWRKRSLVYFVVLVIAPTIYFTGFVEWLHATSIEKFTWPLDFDSEQLIQGYRSKSLMFEPIYERKFAFTLLPEEGCNGQCPEVATAAENSCQESLNVESTEYQDIIQADFIDTYTNNTYKTMTSLRYSTEYCRETTSYVLLIDDDYALNIYNLEAYIRFIGKPAGLYGGKTWWDSQPFRLPLHKHYVSLKDYPFSQYPPFVTAGAILLSIDVAEKLYVGSKFTKYYPFDDVFFGIVAKKMGLTPTDMGDLIPSYFSVPKMTDDRNKALIGSHRFGKLSEVDYIHKEHGNQQYLEQKDIKT